MSASHPSHESQTIYLNLGEVLAAHEAAMARTGYASAPLRDQGALESAIARPRMLAHYEGADLLTQAVVLMLAVSQAQAFVDGNKRTAMTVGLTFLRVNGSAFRGDSELLAVLIEEAASQPQDEARARIMEWLRPHIVAVPESHLT
jgi:death-on-curing protein